MRVERSWLIWAGVLACWGAACSGKQIGTVGQLPDDAQAGGEAGSGDLGAAGASTAAGHGSRTSVHSCTDGLRNGDESDIDCGGGQCVTCPTAAGCERVLDCESQVCRGGVCQADACDDGVKNGDETDVDCAGGCAACANGRTCERGSDCVVGVCKSGRCQAASCTDGVRNGSETDVDCGGSDCSACVDGRACHVATDCKSGSCDAGRCISCDDGVENGSETDVDCGGPDCGRCALGKHCFDPAQDCQSGVCAVARHLTGDNECLAAHCGNGNRDADESDTDCGGADCAECWEGLACNTQRDCLGPVPCTEHVCLRTCETASDCGENAECIDGACSYCRVDQDCVDGQCKNGYCH